MTQRTAIPDPSDFPVFYSDEISPYEIMRKYRTVHLYHCVAKGVYRDQGRCVATLTRSPRMAAARAAELVGDTAIFVSVPKAPLLPDFEPERARTVGEWWAVNSAAQ